MPDYFGAFSMVLLIGTVLIRARLLKRDGIQAMNFGKLDKTDFFIPPFAMFYLYIVFAAAFKWPSVSRQVFFQFNGIAWVGAFFCLAGWMILLMSLVAFGKSFRVGIDTEHPDRLVTGGIFAFTRNPIYVGFAFVLIGQFLIFPNWILLVYLAAAIWLFHRQVLREEGYLKEHYGQEYADYCKRVRRYI